MCTIVPWEQEEGGGARLRLTGNLHNNQRSGGLFAVCALPAAPWTAAQTAYVAALINTAFDDSASDPAVSSEAAVAAAASSEVATASA